jgi:succinyl-CoA synthetase beta subunit
MMLLHEYQTKSIFAKYSIPIPNGRLAFSAKEAKYIAEELGGKVVIKAQVLSSGRGKAGGIRLAKNPEETEILAEKILGMEIRGMHVGKILVDEAIHIAKEVYLGIVFDRSLQAPMMLASGSGGGDIEEVARYAPEKIVKIEIDPLIGLHEYQIRDIASKIDLPGEQWRNFNKIAKALWQVFLDNDAILVEINPLVITTEGTLVALDGKMSLDANALYRHPEITQFQDLEDKEEKIETEAKKFGLSYIKLGGNIGCMTNGAGLGMATMDAVDLGGGKPANFLDIGSGASAEKISVALEIIAADPAVQVVLINIIGGLTRCDEVAMGIINTVSQNKIPVPVVARLSGNQAEQGMALLKSAEINSTSTLSEAVEIAISYTRG